MKLPAADPLVSVVEAFLRGGQQRARVEVITLLGAGIPKHCINF